MGNKFKSVGLQKASEKLKSKLKSDEKVSLNSYILSKTENQEEEKTPQDPHAVKPHRKGFRMSSTALNKLQKVYVSRYSEDPSITHSTLICEAVDLLFAKQNRKKTEKNYPPEQSDLFSP